MNCRSACLFSLRIIKAGEMLRGVEMENPLAHLSSHARWLSKGTNANPFAERVAPLFQVDLPVPSACSYCTFLSTFDNTTKAQKSPASTQQPEEIYTSAQSVYSLFCVLLDEAPLLKFASVVHSPRPTFGDGDIFSPQAIGNLG